MDVCRRRVWTKKLTVLRRLRECKRRTKLAKILRWQAPRWLCRTAAMANGMICRELPRRLSFVTDTEGTGLVWHLRRRPTV